jgi:TRAP-type C4-dicarboxylate transport system permease small subunit
MNQARTGRLGSAFDRLLTATAYVSGGICVAAMLIVTYDVIMRYFFTRPTKWVTDISTLCIPFVTLLAAAWTLKRDMHIKIDIVQQMLKKRSRAMLEVIASILALLASVVFLWQSSVVTWETYREGEALYRTLIIPKFLVLWPFPFGALLLCIQFVRRAWAQIMICKTEGLAAQDRGGPAVAG